MKWVTWPGHSIRTDYIAHIEWHTHTPSVSIYSSSKRTGNCIMHLGSGEVISVEDSNAIDALEMLIREEQKPSSY